MLIVIRKILFLTLPLMMLTVAHANTGVSASDDMRKVGEGEFRWFGLPIYTASLWADEKVSRERLYGSKLLLTLEYDRNVSKQRIVDTTLGEWKRVSDEQLERQRRWADLMLSILPDVKPGDRLSSLMIPGEETRFYLDGTEIGRIADPDFGPEFLAIWLDRKTRSDRLREKLLADVRAVS